MNESLKGALRQLRLSGADGTLDVRLQEARGNRLDYDEFLELVLRDELAVRDDRLVGRRLKAAQFPSTRTLDQFDWDFNPSINRRQIFQLATCEFVRQAKDVLFVGPPGTGKTHLAQALGHQAVKAKFTVLYRSIFDLVRDFMREEDSGGVERTLARYLKPDLLIVDDMGLKQLPRRSGEYLFEIVMRRYELRSTAMTSNRPIEEWGKLIGDVPAAGAILDRFLHHAEIIAVNGRSYRLKDKAATTGEWKQQEVAEQ